MRHIYDDLQDYFVTYCAGCLLCYLLCRLFIVLLTVLVVYCDTYRTGCLLCYLLCWLFNVLLTVLVV